MSKLVDAEMSAKNHENARMIAEKSAQMLPVQLSEMEKNSEYAFLREKESFQEFVNEYKEKLK